MARNATEMNLRNEGFGEQCPGERCALSFVHPPGGGGCNPLPVVVLRWPRGGRSPGLIQACLSDVPWPPGLGKRWTLAMSGLTSDKMTTAARRLCTSQRSGVNWRSRLFLQKLFCLLLCLPAWGGEVTHPQRHRASGPSGNKPLVGRPDPPKHTSSCWRPSAAPLVAALPALSSLA